MSSNPIILTGNDLRLEDVALVAYDTSVQVQLSSEAIPQIEATRKVVESVVESDELVYSVNTGFGALSNICIEHDEVDQLQVNLIRSHASGRGTPLSSPIVRAMMLLRANTLAKGFSGVRVELVEKLLELLNKKIHPIVPEQGSLGASGDLAPLGHMALVLIGEGEAEFQGTRMSGKEALDKVGIEPIVLKAKEGLALLNGTQMMTALGTLTFLKAKELVQLADLAGSMTIEAIKGTHKPFDHKVSQVRPHSGQVKSAAFCLKLLENSEIAESHKNCGRVQDAYSLRCIPQVHGAVYDMLDHVEKTLTIEMNASTDNPLVFPDGTIISQGNFHGEPVAMALDMLSIGLSELSSISERRIDKLMNPVFSDLPAFLTGSKYEGLHSGMMILHYTAASLVSENKSHAHPAVLDSIPTSNDKEDHVSMGATSARHATRIFDNARWVIAAELVAAAQGLEFHKDLKAGNGVDIAYKEIRKRVKRLIEDRSLTADVEAIVDIIRDGTLVRTVLKGVGEPLPASVT